MKLPSYLKRNGFDIYHFRIKVPKNLVKSVGKTEVCKSLRTSCEATARRKALVLAHEAEMYFKSVARGVEKRNQLDFCGSQPQLDMIVPDNKRHIEPISDTTTNGTEKVPMSENILLSEMISLFIAAKKLDGVWKPEEEKKNTRMLLEMKDLLGDKCIQEYTREDARKYKKKVTQLPKRTSNKRIYAGLGIKECIAKKPEGAETLSLSTVNKYIEICSSAFSWAIEDQLTKFNPFRGMRYSKKAMKRQGIDTRPSEARNELSDEDIIQLFSGLPVNSLRPRKASYPLDFWGVLIAAYTGARASEIAQLLYDDIVEKHGVWCFRFANDKDENHGYDLNRSQKSVNALRLVPIHRTIIEAGFEEYVNLVGSGALFPQEIPVKGRFGHRLSKDFSTFRKDMDVDGNGQTFHGFRHSHANKLSDAGIRSKTISDLHGRSRGTGETDIRYIKATKVKELNEAVQIVEYNDALKYLPRWDVVKKYIEFDRVNAQGGTLKSDRLKQ